MTAWPGDRPRIAVLITYFNEGELLTECIESVVRQAEAPDEVLVYDDASSIPPGPFVPQDVPVTIIRGATNRGPGHGRNVLVESTTCEFVHFHDADDLVDPNWARSIRAALVRNDVDLVLTDLTSIRDGKVASREVMGLVDGLRADDDLVRFALRGALLLPSSTSRRTIVKQIGGFRTRSQLQQSEDFEFHVRLAAAVGDRYTVIPEPLIIQRLRTQSHSSNKREVWASAVTAVRHLSTELPPVYRQDLSDAAARVASRLFQMGHWQDAQESVRLSRKLGRPRFRHQSVGYRIIAGAFGQRAAERVSRAYRRVLPSALRRALNG